MKLFFDGGCRPGGMETAVVAGGEASIARDLGPGTSMTAEWLALIAAARLARALAVEAPVLLGDAAAVIAQAKGTVRCPPAHRGHLETFLAIAAAGPAFRLRHVRRTQNLAGIALDSLSR